jgi:uncharacterized protein YjlB
MEHQLSKLSVAELSPNQLTSRLFADDGTFPNNPILPLLLYQDIIPPAGGKTAAMIEELFESNSWGGTWRNGLNSFHHYHSTAHEALGVYRGSAEVQLGGERGVTVTVQQGDLMIIPAGVAHKNLGSSADFRVVGAYPRGQHPDMCYGKEAERPRADNRINAVALPQGDPVYGPAGPLAIHWKIRQ